jgi:hypothetical protein
MIELSQLDKATLAQAIQHYQLALTPPVDVVELINDPQYLVQYMHNAAELHRCCVLASKLV